MSDFDDLTPRHASVHTNEEVLEWFHEVNLVDVKDLSRRTSVTGLRK